MKYALAFAITLAVFPAAAQVQTYSFFGYVPCTKGQIGCAQWVEPPHAWVRMTFGNGLTYAECKPLQDQSHALTGAGFCDPFIK